MTAAPRPQWEGHTDRVRYAATISPCGTYRYDLEREFDPSGPWVMFLGLNPSTADAQIDDPTIRREMDFGQGFGFPNLVKTNLYGLRSTDPKGRSSCGRAASTDPSATRSGRPRSSRSLIHVRSRLALGPLFLSAACSTWAHSGSLLRDPCVHLGVRPASDGAGDYALTVQVTTDWPSPCQREPR